MNLIDIHRQCKELLHYQLITITDLFERFDFYFKHLKNNTNKLL